MEKSKKMEADLFYWKARKNKVRLRVFFIEKTKIYLSICLFTFENGEIKYGLIFNLLKMLKLGTAGDLLKEKDQNNVRLGIYFIDWN